MRLRSRNGEPGSRRAPGSHRPRPRWRAGLRIPFATRQKKTRRATILSIGVLLLAGVLLVGLRLSRGGVLPNIRLAGRSVGGLDAAALRRVVQTVATERTKVQVAVIRPATDGFPQAIATATRQDVGYRVDVEATVQEILHRGRQANPVAALADHLFASFFRIDVQPIERIDHAAFDRWASGTVNALTIPAREGDLSFSGATVSEVDPGPGIGVAADRLRRDAAAAMSAGTPVMISARTVPLQPRMTVQAVKDALADATYALSGPVRLLRGKQAITFTPDELGQILEAEPVEKNGALVLQLVADPGRLEAVAGKDIQDLEIPAVDARFVPTGDGVAIIPSKNGFGFDPPKAADALITAATSPTRQARLRGRVVKPSFSTADAKALHIDQMVSTFTTYYQCCPPRVTNIHRIADILDGSVVMPGDVFSVNAIVGERTPEKGFVIAPGITEGQIVDQLGGGISQFGTTIFNAVFFGGYQFVEFQHHSYYFTRYPAGRDATISWTSPDFSFKNDSNYGIYIDTSYTDTSVTVTFYGHKDFTVEAVTTGPYNYTNPPTQCMSNPKLKAGLIVTTQEGSKGFDILVKRVFHFKDGTTRVESFFTNYKPEPMIIEQKDCGSTPPPSPSP